MMVSSNPAILLVFLTAVYGSSQSDPCSVAVNIGDPHRSIDYIPGDNDAWLSDDSIGLDGLTWYRFDAVTGGKMPEQCIDLLYCGTFGTIWLDGSHPTASNPGPVTRQVCGHYQEDDCCGWKADISVIRCFDSSSNKEFFVYELVPTPYSMAYCAGTGVQCPSGQSWYRVNSSCVDNPTMSAPVLGTPYISNWTIIQTYNATRFSIDCRIPIQTIDDNVKFNVAFEVDGHIIATFQRTPRNPLVELDEFYLRGHLGKTLTCVATAYLYSFDSSSPHSASMPSNGYWFGMRPQYPDGTAVSSPVVMKTTDNLIFHMKLTFPVTFAQCFDTPSLCYKATGRRYIFKITEDSSKVTSSCLFYFTQAKAISDPITIVPGTVLNNNIGRTDVAGIILFKNISGNAVDESIFLGYDIDSLQVKYYDEIPKPRCSSHSDPHISPFPSAVYGYELQRPGDFCLLKSRDRILEVQVRHIPCFQSENWKPFCNCGVIARENNNIIGVTACDTHTSPILVQFLVDDGPRGTITNTGNGWQINLLSGITITANNFYGNYLELEVLGIRDEVYDGICSENSNSDSDLSSFRYCNN